MSAISAVLTARWERKANGRISPKEAAELAALQSSYRAGFWATDMIAMREPGDLASAWKAYMTLGSATRASCLASMKTFAVAKYFSYGPRFGWTF